MLGCGTTGAAYAAHKQSLSNGDTVEERLTAAAGVVTASPAASKMGITSQTLMAALRKQQAIND